jgi:hypothetical protein
MEQSFYNYAALDNLTNNIDNIPLDNIVIKISSYEIKNKDTHCFLKYLLYKDEVTETMTFPILPLTYTNINSDNIISMSKLKLFTLLQLKSYSDFDNAITFKGFFLENDQTIYIFFDLTQCNIELHDVYRRNKMWFALLDEIVNYKKMCDIFIDSSVSRFFVNNDEFIFLQNKNGENYEIPIVGFVGINENKVSFVYTFGNAASDTNALLGPYYYFTDFTNSISQCIVRFALFLGKMKVIENFPNDDFDSSVTKKERISDANLDKNMEILTMRISDHDGKWAENYDSVFLGKIELDNGTYLKNTPIYVVKTYEQQIPLSYHFIDKSNNLIM